MAKFGITERGDIAFTDEYTDKILNRILKCTSKDPTNIITIMYVTNIIKLFRK